ncbi:MAG: pseudouridine synthase [Planctomycetota bacterium]
MVRANRQRPGCVATVDSLDHARHTHWLGGQTVLERPRGRRILLGLSVPEPMPASEVLVVERENAGIRLHDLLAGNWPDMHRRHLRQLVAGGEVSVNGETVLHDQKLRVGDVVLISAAPPGGGGSASPAVDNRTSSSRARSSSKPAGKAKPAAVDVDLRVLFESTTALVVEKPAGMPSVPDRSGREPGVHGRLRELRPDDDLRIVHRLDRNTSGCLLLAKGLDAARHFDRSFRERLVAKTYVALVSGVPHFEERSIDLWLGPDRRRPGKVVASDHDRRGYREAHTDVSVRERYDRHALVELRPSTGRGHQLRVHLQAIGHTIVGDTDYAGEQLLLSRLKPDYKKRKGVTERPLLQRMFLHAERIACPDVDGQSIMATCPLPDDLAVALRHVEKHTR